MFSALLILSVSLASSALVPHGARAGFGGGTTYSVSGTNVTITVNIDFSGLSGDPEEFDTVKVEGAVSLAQDAWNAALANLPAEGCYPVKVVFVAHVLKPNQNFEQGFHVMFADAERSGTSVSWDPGTNDPTEDTTTAYDDELRGYWYTDTMQVPGWEHEIGHLMGLGDDYLLEDVKIGGITYTIANPLPGRGPTKDDPTGTLMAGGLTIDQNLADRLVSIAKRAGMKLPKCDVWRGPIHIAASLNGGGASESGTADGEVVLHEDSGGQLAGTVTVKRTSGCTAYPPYADGVVLNEMGEDRDARLTVNSTLASPSPQSLGNGICGFPDGAIADFGQGPGGEPGGSPVEPFVIVKTSASAAQGSGTIVDVEDFGGGSPVVTIKFDYTVKLTKQVSS